MAHELPGAGWYHDPWQINTLRWWDGVTWTGWTSSWSARTDQPTIEHRSTTAPPAGLGVAPADGQPIRTADPFEVPCVLVGKTAEWVQPLALFFFAGCALVAILATTFGNHLPIGWKLITGVAVQTALFLLFAAGGFYTLRHPPSLVLSSDRVVIRTRFRSTEVPWQERHRRRSEGPFR